MSNWENPLPKHNKYDEYYAKVVLEELFPRDFVDLDIKDKPDLQSKDGNIGIEVTIASNQNVKSERLYVDILYDRVRDKDNTLKEIQKCGCSLESGILVGKSGTDSFSEIYVSFKKKLTCLNKGLYQCFQQNNLFIFSPIFADDKMLADAVLHMQKELLSFERCFHKVFVLVPGHCYCLDLTKGCYENIEVTPSTQFKQAIRARQIAEGD